MARENLREIFNENTRGFHCAEIRDVECKMSGLTRDEMIEPGQGKKIFFFAVP